MILWLLFAGFLGWVTGMVTALTILDWPPRQDPRDYRVPPGSPLDTLWDLWNERERDRR